MSKIHDISDRYRKRVMQIENCVGCNKKIEEDEEYTQVVMPSDDVDTHIALCKACSFIAKEEAGI